MILLSSTHTHSSADSDGIVKRKANGYITIVVFMMSTNNASVPAKVMKKKPAFHIQ